MTNTYIQKASTTFVPLVVELIILKRKKIKVRKVDVIPYFYHCTLLIKCWKQFKKHKWTSEYTCSILPWTSAKILLLLFEGAGILAHTKNQSPTKCDIWLVWSRRLHLQYVNVRTAYECHLIRFLTNAVLKWCKIAKGSLLDKELLLG